MDNGEIYQFDSNSRAWLDRNNRVLSQTVMSVGRDGAILKTRKDGVTVYLPDGTQKDFSFTDPLPDTYFGYNQRN